MVLCISYLITSSNWWVDFRTFPYFYRGVARVFMSEIQEKAKPYLDSYISKTR